MVTRESPASGIVRLKEYLEMEDEALMWVVDGLIAEGGLALLSGRPKVGKTTLARHLALAAARGRSWLGRDIDPYGVPVLCLLLEDIPAGDRAEYRKLGSMADDPQVFVATDRHAFRENQIETLRAKIAGVQARLCIIDPLISFLPMPDTDAYAKVYAAMEPLRNLARDTGCAILCCHHHRKSNTGEHGVRSMGSTAFTAVVDITIDLNWDGPGSPRTVTSEQRYGEPIEERALSIVNGLASVGVTKAAAGRDEATRKILEVVADNPGLNTRELREAAKVKNAMVSRLLDDLEESGQIRREKAATGRAIRHYLADEAA